MSRTAFRTVMTLLLLAGIALALSTQSAAARGGSGGVAVIVNGDRLPVRHIMKTHSRHHVIKHRITTSHGKRHFGPRVMRTHRFGGSAVDQRRKHSRHDANNIATRIFERSAAHRSGFHSGRVFHSDRGFHKPPHHAHARHGFKHGSKPPHRLKAPRIIFVEPTRARRTGPHGIVVIRGGDPRGPTVGQRSRAFSGGKLIVLPSSPHFKHIVVGK